MLEGEDKLIVRAKKGEKECFGQLYDHYTPQIYRFILLKVTNRHEAEDLTHDVFLSAWQNLRGYKSQGFPFSSWLYQIARNKVIDHYRTKKFHANVDELDESAVKLVDMTENNLEKVLSLEVIQKAMKNLNSEQQDVLIMKFIEDLPHRDIAATLGKSEGAVRLIQHRALNALREQLGDRSADGESNLTDA